jgi:DNA adenine methylase
MSFYTPLRYPGGKGKLALYLKAILSENNLIGCNYSEVYAGGAGVAMELLLDGYVSSICINDLNTHIHAFWSCVLNKTNELCMLINETEVTIEEWHRQKKIYGMGSKAPILEQAFATFFLNRSNRSGIMKAGVIGGKNQDGKWKLDARYNKTDLVGRIRKIAEQREKIELTQLDGVDFIQDRVGSNSQPSIVYLDPPYYVKGAGLYDNFYSHDDHLAVANALRQVKGVNWVVSYDNVPEIEEMYKGFLSIKYGLSYSAAQRYRAAEIMFFSRSVKSVPNLEDYGYKRVA